MFDVFYIGPKPNLFAHECEVSSIEQAQQLSRTRYCWIVNYLSDYSGFDFLWEPVPWEADQRHAWASQWQKDSGTYLVPKHPYTETSYRKDFTITRLNDRTNWTIPTDCDIENFDFSWHPDPTEPALVYQFGTQWQKTGGPVYRVPGAVDIKYVQQPRVTKTSIDPCWEIPDNIDRNSFDWTWHPDATDDLFIYQFGTQHQKTNGPVYRVPGATEIKYVLSPRATKTDIDPCWTVPDGIDTGAFDWTWHPDASDGPFIYQFGTQWQKTGGPVYTVPGATDIKYATAQRSIKISIDSCWQLPAGTEFADFDYTWHPDATDSAYIYQFGTQHQKTGGPQYVVNGAVDVKYVDQIKIKTQRVATGVYLIDHMDNNVDVARSSIEEHIPVTKVARYFDNYLDTLRRLARSIPDDQEFVWICSSVCDYTNFDFSWHPEQWQAGMLHVFASDGEKFGDTFFMHVPTFKYRSDKCQLLEWYDVNFVETSVPRRPMPVIVHDYDSQVEAIQHTTWTGPLAFFQSKSFKGRNLNSLPVVPLWREKTKTVIPCSPGASGVIVPKVAVPVIKKQVYDYPHIDKTQRKLYDDQLLDIVFISNGEVNADYNYEKLKFSVGDRNRVHRVDRIPGRVAAYHAAAATSSTPWFFAVFAKLEVEAAFDWAWQPDRLQQPKHYIFHARNPVNGLEYGHQAMIAYNKMLTLANTGTGLDFTLDSAHEVVPILSGTAYYFNDPWMCWRTAFREVLKLRASLPDVENEYRMNQWIKDCGPRDDYAFAKWSHIGAQDAIEYYDSVNGDFDELKKSYEWAWLASYAFVKHNLSPDQ